MKILFLDIDGVLNYHDFLVRAHEARRTSAKRDQKIVTIHDAETWEGMLAPECVARLEKLVQVTDASVVISSSWRHANPWAKIHKFLRKKGFTGRVIGATPIDIRRKLSQHVERGDEIEAWLDAWDYGSDKMQPVESFVILDDNSVGGNVESRLVRTSPHTGLLDSHVDEAIHLFDVPFKRKKKSLFIPRRPTR